MFVFDDVLKLEDKAIQTVLREVASETLIVALKGAVGDAVKIGQTVVVLESMKMELHVTAPFDGSVAAVRCKVGDMVERHQVLAEVAPLE